jgi:DNA-binding CsgD family transcriptional regulator
MGGLQDAVVEWGSARARAVELLLDSGAISLALVHGAALLGSDATISDVTARADDGPVDGWVKQLDGQSIRVREAARSTQKRFVEVVRDRVCCLGAVEYHYEIFDRGRFVARVVAIPNRRSEPMRRRLNALTTPLRKLLVEVDRELRTALPQKPGFAVFKADGDLQLADETALAWLDATAIQRTIGHQVSIHAARERPFWSFSTAGVEVRLMSLNGNEGPAYLAELRQAQPLTLTALSHLTPMQRKVAEQASTGLTVGEIAKALTVAPETVRTHLREIYRRLSVSSRLELSRAMDDRAWIC